MSQTGCRQTANCRRSGQRLRTGAALAPSRVAARPAAAPVRRSGRGRVERPRRGRARTRHRIGNRRSGPRPRARGRRSPTNRRPAPRPEWRCGRERCGAEVDSDRPEVVEAAIKTLGAIRTRKAQRVLHDYLRPLYYRPVLIWPRWNMWQASACAKQPRCSHGWVGRQQSADCPKSPGGEIRARQSPRHQSAAQSRSDQRATGPVERHRGFDQPADRSADPPRAGAARSSRSLCCRRRKADAPGSRECRRSGRRRLAGGRR